MRKHYRCVNDTADDMQYPELHKKHSNLDEDMFKKGFFFGKSMALTSPFTFGPLNYQMIIFSPNDSPLRPMKNVFYFI